MTSGDPVDAIRKLMLQQHFAVLATERQGTPYTSLVAFCASEDLRSITMVTNRATRKFANLNEEARISLLVDDTGNREADLLEATAVTTLGRIAELKGEERRTALSRYVERHPRLEDFASAPSCALLAIQVEKYIMVRRFQQVFEYVP